jgi:hypothetical protein
LSDTGQRQREDRAQHCEELPLDFHSLLAPVRLEIRLGNYNGDGAKCKSSLFKPAAAVSDPPREVDDRDGSAHRPPQGQNQIGDQPK